MRVHRRNEKGVKRTRHDRTAYLDPVALLVVLVRIRNEIFIARLLMTTLSRGYRGPTNVVALLVKLSVDFVDLGIDRLEGFSHLDDITPELRHLGDCSKRGVAVCRVGGMLSLRAGLGISLG